MKIIILCNAECTMSKSFSSPLTFKGEKYAVKLADILKKKSIDRIYCSPFLNSMLTIYPFCSANNKKIKIEPAFQDIQQGINKNGNMLYFNSIYDNLSNPKYEFLNKIVNEYYQSQVLINNILLYEERQDVINRLNPVLYSIIEKYKTTDYNILIVTHKTIIDAIKEFFDKRALHIQKIIRKQNSNADINYEVEYISGQADALGDSVFN